MNRTYKTLSIVLISLIFTLWNYFIKGHVLPPVDEIDFLTIHYSEAAGEFLSDDYEPKEFKIIDRNTIKLIRDLIGVLPVSRVPLIDSKDMNDGPNWIINIYFINDGHRFIYVDENQIMGQKLESSKLYDYLEKNYT